MDKLKKSLTNKIVNCETYEESDQYFEILDMSRHDCDWNVYVNKTCYRIRDNEPAYSDIEFYETDFPNQKIYKFSDLIKEKNMKIVLEFEKIISVGEMMYQLIDFHLAKKDNLPHEYIEGKPCIFLNINNSLGIINIDDVAKFYYRGDIVTRSQKFELVELCKKSGKRLNSINKKLRKINKKKNWKGVERIEI